MGRGASELAARAGAEGAVIRARPRPVIVPSLAAQGLRRGASFGHHAEVASLPEPEQDFWLRKAEELGWSTSRLRQQVRASLAERAEQRELEPASGPGACGMGQAEDAHQPMTVRIHLTAEQARLCQLAADKQSLTVPTWAVQVLGHAAYNSLELPASPAPPGGE